jgi:hypothetical protein
MAGSYVNQALHSFSLRGLSTGFLQASFRLP